MKHSFKHFLISCITLIFYFSGTLSAQSSDDQDYLALIKKVDVERLINEIRDFSSPAFEGRELGTIGNQKATDWIEFKFKEIGLDFLPNRNSYEIPFNINNFRLGTHNELVTAGSEAHTYTNPSIAPAVWGNNSSIKTKSILDTAAVYSNRIVISPIPNELDFSEATFQKMMSVSEDFYQRGAAGVVFIWSNDLKDGVSLYRFEDFVEIPLLSEKNVTNTGKPFISIKQLPIPILFANESIGRLLIQDIGEEIEMTTDFSVDLEGTASNLIGYLPGKSDRLDKANVILAYFDQEGSNSVDGTPYLGSNSNATGVVAMLEIALLFKKYHKPENPVVFIALNGKRRLNSGLQAIFDMPEFSLLRFKPWLELESLGYTIAEEDISHVVLSVHSSALEYQKLATTVMKRPKIEGTLDTTLLSNPYRLEHYFHLTSDKSPYSNRIMDSQNKINFITYFRMVLVAVDLSLKLND